MQNDRSHSNICYLFNLCREHVQLIAKPKNKHCCRPILALAVVSDLGCATRQNFLWRIGPCSCAIFLASQPLSTRLGVDGLGSWKRMFVDRSIQNPPAEASLTPCIWSCKPQPRPPQPSNPCDPKPLRTPKYLEALKPRNPRPLNPVLVPENHRNQDFSGLGHTVKRSTPSSNLLESPLCRNS